VCWRSSAIALREPTSELPGARVIAEESRGEALRMCELEVWEELELVHASVARQLDRALECDHGLTLHGFKLLSMIVSVPGVELQMSDIAARLQLTPSGVTRLVERLERDDLVVRVRDLRDRRVIHTNMTTSGSARLLEATKTYHAVVHEFFPPHFSPRERSALRPSRA
jgi:DNA-binding MarR family transcriptional regulator